MSNHNPWGMTQAEVLDWAETGMALAAEKNLTPTQPVRNFCETCGKRLGGLDHIHTCTPPIVSP